MKNWKKKFKYDLRFLTHNLPINYYYEGNSIKRN